MNNDPIIAPSVVAEPVPEPKVEVPPMPESVWLLIYMRKTLFGEWSPGATEFKTREHAMEHLVYLNKYRPGDPVYHPHIVRVDLKAEPKREENPGAPQSQTLTQWAVGVISEAVAEFRTLRDKLAEVEAANAELRARLDAIKPNT